MEIEQTVQEWKPMLTPALKSKVGEFLQMGYSRTTAESIWHCLEQRVWKGNPVKRIHEVVQDIFHLSPNEYMSYLTMDAYQDDDGLMASIAALTKQSKQDDA